MPAFREAVDEFIAEEKSAVGKLAWGPSRDRTGVSAYWLIATPLRTTEHRLHIAAYPDKPYPCFRVMVEFKWQGREFPIIRLNVDTDLQTHINHPPRPAGVDSQVSGNRLYAWALNRAAFRPFTLRGLPYCVSFRPQGISFPSAIRAVAAEARIDLSNVDLPESPARITLL